VVFLTGEFFIEWFVSIFFGFFSFLPQEGRWLRLGGLSVLIFLV
jgi:hypothetical protein